MSDTSDERKAVPREPDQTMVDAGWAAYYKHATPGMMPPIWRAMYDAAPAEQPTEILNAICQDLLIMAEHRESLETRGVIADCVRRAWDAGHIAGALQAPAEPPKDTAALIERLHRAAVRAETNTDANSILDAIARLSAPVPDKEKE